MHALPSRVLRALIAATAVLQLWLAHHYFGFYTGDEVEVLSEAFRFATDYPYGTWDVRNTFIADVVVAPFLWIATRLGVTSRAALVVIATIPFALASSLTIGIVHRLALRWTSDPLPANAAAIVFALHWIPVGFGSTTYPRVIAMACIAAAALLVANVGAGFSPPEDARLKPGATSFFAAGALIGVAFADRYSEIIYLLPLLIVARRRAWQVALGALASIALLAGVWDWIAWGAPFHSLRKFAQRTLLDGEFASRVKLQPVYWYLTMLPRWCAPTLLPLLWSARRVRNAWWFVLIPLAALSLIAHKELRYLQGIIPFLAILAGAGFATWWRARRNVAAALLALSLAWGLWGLRFLGRESRPAVEAARVLGANPSLQTLAIGQLWAYGDRIYLGNHRRLIDIGTPVHSLDRALREADAVSMYESDVTPEVARALAEARFTRTHVFRAPLARDVVVFTERRHPAGRSAGF